MIDHRAADGKQLQMPRLQPTAQPGVPCPLALRMLRFGLD